MNNTPQGRVEEKRAREKVKQVKQKREGGGREDGQRRAFIIDKGGVQSLQLSESMAQNLAVPRHGSQESGPSRRTGVFIPAAAEQSKYEYMSSGMLVALRYRPGQLNTKSQPTVGGSRSNRLKCGAVNGAAPPSDELALLFKRADLPLHRSTCQKTPQAPGGCANGNFP